MEELGFIFILIAAIVMIIALPLGIIWAFDHNDWDKEDTVTQIPGSKCQIVETYESNQWNNAHRNTHREVLCPR